MPEAASARTSPGSWHALARAMAASWPAAQMRDGAFRGGLRGARSTGYGTAMLGYALVQTGVREHDRRLLRAGIRALSRTVRRRRRKNRDGDGVFESLAVAAAYNVARAHARRDPGFRRHRRAWVRWLRHVRPVYLGVGVPGRGPWWRSYFNKHLIEAVEILELLRTGLRSRERGSVLRDRRRAGRLARGLVERTVPALARAGAFDLGGGRQAALVRPDSRLHLAYHALTLGFYGRAVELLDLLGRRRAGPVARATLRRLATTSWGVTAPDGDLAYAGRSAEQAWALTFTAYGAGVAARVSRGQTAARFDALASRAIGRLALMHRDRRGRYRMIPSLAHAGRVARRGLDDYASAVDYGGLSLMALNWAVDRRPSTVGAGLASDAEGAGIVRFGWGALAAVRSGAIWFAVKSAVGPPTCMPLRRQHCTPGRRRYDLRNDFGLLALKAQQPGGAFADLLPQRPRAGGSAESAGPLLLGDRGPVLPIGYSTLVAADGSVTVRGAFVSLDGRSRRRATFAFRPSGGGVDETFGTSPGDRYELSFFFRRRPGVSRSGSAIVARDDRYAVAISPVRTLSTLLRGGYASATDARLWRLRIRAVADGGGPVAVAYRPAR